MPTFPGMGTDVFLGYEWDSQDFIENITYRTGKQTLGGWLLYISSPVCYLCGHQ